MSNFSVPTSTLPGVRWPAIPAAPGAALMAMLFQFEQTQWWPADRLREHQSRQAGELLRHAAASVPLYRERLAGFPAAASPAELAEAWSRLPLLTRSDIQTAGATLHSASVPPRHGKTFKATTSGSTGTPVTVLQSGLNMFMWRAFTLRDILWHRRDVTGKLAIIRSEKKTTAQGAALAGWGASAELIWKTGPAAALHASTEIDAQRRWLIDQDPHYLLTLPTNLRALLECFAASGGASGGGGLLNLREVRTMGETCPPELRALVRERWGVPLHDIYSSIEVGYMALQCPEHEHYHVQSEGVLLEVLDDDGRPCAAGEVGRIVVTVLHNFATPLIRYEVQDYAEVGEPCACGRGLPVLKRILGRQRNMLRLPGGKTHWPSLPESAWASVAPIRQMQVVQHELERVEARLVIDRDLTPAEAATLTRNLQACLRFPHRIELTRLDRIERGKNGKFEDFVCRVR